MRFGLWDGWDMVVVGALQVDIIGGDVGGVREDEMDDGIERLWGQERIGGLASNQGLSRECVMKAVMVEVLFGVRVVSQVVVD